MEHLDNSDDKLNRIEKIIKESYHPTTDELENYILYYLNPLERLYLLKSSQRNKYNYDHQPILSPA